MGGHRGAFCAVSGTRGPALQVEAQEAMAPRSRTGWDRPRGRLFQLLLLRTRRCPCPVPPATTGLHSRRDCDLSSRDRPNLTREASTCQDPRGSRGLAPPSWAWVSTHRGGRKAAVGSVPSKALTSGLQAGPWGVTVINEVEKGSAGAVPACSRRLPCALRRVPIPHPPSTAVALGPAACPATHPARGGAAGLAPPRGGAGATSQDTWAPGHPLTQYEKQSHLERPTPGAPSERGAC